MTVATIPDIDVEVHKRTPREINVDKVRFERVLGNLIENANHHGWAARALRTNSPADYMSRDTTTGTDATPYTNAFANAIFSRAGDSNGVPAGYAHPVSGGQ